jgi:hypothetical protein
MFIDQIKKTVVFLEASWTDPISLLNSAPNRPTVKSTIGTGFLIFSEVPELGKDPSGNQLGLNFLVTAKHMIRQKNSTNEPGPYARKMTLRFNVAKPVDASGRQWDSAETDIIDARGDLVWFVDDLDPAADIALTPISLDRDKVEYKAIDRGMFATRSLMAEQHVNENDEVLFTGLLTNYLGAQKNYPVVRHGRLALLPGEDVATESAMPNSKTQIYLAELTSFGGNSGSPVFLRVDPLRESTTGIMRLEYKYYLLGVMKGFLSDQEAKQNAGIAMVVPADKILEVLSRGRVTAFVARVVAQNMVTKGDLKAAEAKYLESIAILERLAPNSSQLVDTLRDYGGMLASSKNTTEAQSILAQAKKIADQPVSKTPEP